MAAYMRFQGCAYEEEAKKAMFFSETGYKAGYNDGMRARKAILKT